MQYFRNVRFISGCQAIYEAISNTCFIGEDKTEKKYGRQLQSASAIVVKLVIVWFFLTDHRQTSSWAECVVAAGRKVVTAEKRIC